MGAEIGATTSMFGYDEKMADILKEPTEQKLQNWLTKLIEHLTGDEEVYANPEKYFDQVIEINLSELEPHVNGLSLQILHGRFQNLQKQLKKMTGRKN